MGKRIGFTAAAGLLAAALAQAQSGQADQAAPAPTPAPAPPVAGASPDAPPPPAGVVLPAPAPVLRLVDPPAISVESLPTENPFAVAADAPAAVPVKPVYADAKVPATLFAMIRVDPKGKAVTVRRARDPIPSLAAQTQQSLIRWSFDPGRKGGQAVDTWSAVRLDLTADIDGPKVEQFFLTPIAATTPIPKPLDWGTDAAWLESVKPGPPVEGTIANEQLDTPPIPKKQPWSSSSYKGPFSVRFWVKINPAGHVEKSIAIAASDPLLIGYFRKAMESWLFRPARAGNAAVATWNELNVGGQISFSTDLRSTAALRQSL
jgi:hypothetical protein